MSDGWQRPEGHPISEEMARALVGGSLGDVHRQILMGCCRPIYWFVLDPKDPKILDSGTVTLVRTPVLLLGITAAHVMEGYDVARLKGEMRLQIGNAVINDIDQRRIATSAELDIATLDLTGLNLETIGNEVSPLSSWPPLPPSEGGGITLGGYPGQDRRPVARLENTWGLFTAMGIARSVSHDQITWIIPREDEFVVPARHPLPLNYELGGISGGPLISSFESPAGIFSYRLAGIISEAQAQLEYVVAKRADLINADGSIQRP